MIKSSDWHSCYLCGSEGQVVYAGLYDVLFFTPGKWKIRKCMNPACRLLWIDPMPEPQEIMKLYQNYFTHQTSEMEERVFAQELRLRLTRGVLRCAFNYKALQQMAVYQRAAAVLSKFRILRNRVGRSIMWVDGAKLPARLLDLGCGNGDFLVTMRDLGWDVVGVDQDPNAVKVARRNRRVKVYCGTVESLDFPSNFFDVVTLSHVIEHLKKPSETIDELYRILKPGGNIIILTPNSSSLGHWWFCQEWRGLEVPRHLYIYNMRSLSMLVEKSNFIVKSLEAYCGSAHIIYSQSIMAMKKKNKKSFIVNSIVAKILFIFVEHFLKNMGEEIFLLGEKQL